MLRTNFTFITFIIAFQLILTANVHSKNETTASSQNSPTENLLLQNKELPELKLGQPVQKKITGAESHFYKIKLVADQVLIVMLTQNGVDVALTITDSDGSIRGHADSPNGSYGDEELLIIADQKGDHKLEIKPYQADSSKGSYRVEIKALRTATARDKDRFKGYQILSEANELSSKYDADSLRSSLKKYEEALKVFQTANDKRGQALSLYKLGESNQILTNLSQAFVFYDKSLPLWHGLGEKSAEAVILSNYGLAQDAMGEANKATATFERSLKLFQETGDRKGEANVINNIGIVYFKQNQYQKALSNFNQSLAILRSFENPDEALILAHIGACYAELGDYQKAVDSLSKALPLLKALGDKNAEGKALITNGTIHYLLGDYQKALDSYIKALAIFQTLGNRKDEAHALNDIGKTYLLLNNTIKSKEYFEKALTVANASADNYVKSYILNNIGLIYLKEGDQARALTQSEMALSLTRSIRDRHGEAQTLNNIGWILLASDKNQNAIENFYNALSINKETEEKAEESNTLSLLMLGWKTLKNSRLAIFYGKQSVNKYQELRRAIKGLEKETQKTYLGTIEDTYKQLAEILISEGRIIEAEQILRMLKQEEVFDYLRRNRSEADNLSQRADLTAKEAEALKRYNEISSKITSLGTEFGELQEILRKGNELTAEQEKRYDELSEQIGVANRRFQVFLLKLSEEFAARTNTKRDIEENLGLQSDLKSWGKDIVFIYTLVGADRYHTIFVTPETRSTRKSEIKAVDLNKKIFEFRQIVQNPELDPRPLGKELYDILIKPIEKDLEGAKAKTLLWSLDGNLRSLPLAALWDGEQYFGQKYQNVVITLASRTRLGEAVTPNWRALGLGVSEAKIVKAPDGISDIRFSALSAVPGELASIVKTERSPNGILPGESLLDSEFTAKKFKRELVKGYKVIHIASHFMLNPGDVTKSFLLLGDGEALTVDEINNNPQLKFNGVELLTLSACETAVTNKDSTGKEIEGFGYVAQQKGAKAILATLWAVADDSTQILMTEFYHLRKENPQLTKTETIRMAQQSMIKGKLKPVNIEGAKKRSEIFGESDQKISAPKFKFDENAPYAHPYYWAPFVLIGNWR